jgi:large subunit ribosomal protein L23
MHPYEVLKRPIITEKSQWQVGYEAPQYAFEVDTRANKAQIKEAVEVAFDVTVTRVNVMVMAPKRRRNPRSRIIGAKASQVQRSSKWKKAVVQVKPGDRIALFEGVA